MQILVRIQCWRRIPLRSTGLLTNNEPLQPANYAILVYRKMKSLYSVYMRNNITVAFYGCVLDVFVLYYCALTSAQSQRAHRGVPSTSALEMHTGRAACRPGRAGAAEKVDRLRAEPPKICFYFITL